MPAPVVLVLIGGAPGTGKTTLGQRIAGEFALPLFTKDTLKEVLFDALGWSDVAWSRRLGVASVALLFSIAAAQLAAGRSLILESNFRPEFDTPRVLELLRQWPAVPIQCFCQAAPDVVARRFQHRWEAGVRHPGHVEHEQIDTFAATHLQQHYAPLEIGGTCFELDTTDFATLELAPVLAAIRVALAGAAAE
jgi:predicted kinase